MDYSGSLYFTGSAPARASPRDAARSSRPACVAAPDEVHAFLSWLFSRGGLVYGAYRSSAIERRVPACLRQLRVRALPEARALLEQKPELVATALSTLLLGVTGFYRDVAVFSAIRRQVLPELVGASRRVRIWSAACSHGPELFSVAMMLDDLGGLAEAELLGTDCRAEAIARAAAAVFPVETIEPPLRSWRSRHLTAAGVGYVRVSSRLSCSIRWRQSDLLRHTAPGPWDLILWRNMAIYLNAASAVEVWERLYAELRPGGFFVAGRADQPPRHLRLVRVAPCIFRKLGGEQ